MRHNILIFILVSLALVSCGRRSDPFMDYRDGYTVEYVEIYGNPAYLLIPDGVDAAHPAPAVLMLHELDDRFDIGKEKLVRPVKAASDNMLPSSREWVDKYYDGVYFADELCSRGYVVLVADAAYWGNRSSEDAQRWSSLTFLKDSEKELTHREDTIKALADKVYEGQREIRSLFRTNMGSEWSDAMLDDDIMTLSWLVRMDIVDSSRIGCFGFSTGAYRAWLLAANTDLLACAVAQSGMTTVASVDTDSPSASLLPVRYLRSGMDFPDIAAQASPTPMLMLAGENDPFIPRDTVARCFGIMQEKYEKDMLRTEFFDGEHVCSKDVQARIMAYLDEMLR